MKLRALSVTELNEYVSRHIALDPILSNVRLTGEITDFRISSLGHVYFRMNDEKSSVSCVIFESDYESMDFVFDDGVFDDGQYVEITGKVAVYRARGQYQVQVTSILPMGDGEGKLAFERLKKRLDKEGLFSILHKKKLPAFPRKIGVVTSENGAALQDVLKVLRRRAPYLSVMVFPSVVQGNHAPKSIIKALNSAREYTLDALIITRGGGAGEDLSAFNDEMVVRTVFSMSCPVISAIGHEIDTTLCDYVADVRMPTPSTAAEIVAVDVTEMRKELDMVYNNICNIMSLNITTINRRLQLALSQKIKLNHNELDRVYHDLQRMITDNLNKKKNSLDSLASKLHVLSPLATLQRGYTLVENLDGERLNFSEIKKEDTIHVRFLDGKLSCVVKDIDERKR